MTRFKKELRRRGYRLEEDYPWLPYELNNHIFFEGTTVNSETCTYSVYYNVIAERAQFDRSMTPHYSDLD